MRRAARHTRPGDCAGNVATAQLSINRVLFTAVPGLAVVLALLAGVSVARVYETRQRYEGTLAKLYRVDVAVRDARAAAFLEQAVLRTGLGGPTVRRRAAADRRRAAVRALAAVRGDDISERLVGRQLAAQQRVRDAVLALRRPSLRADRLARLLGAADTAASSVVRRQQVLEVEARQRAGRESRAALSRAGVAGGLALAAALTLVWLLLRSMQRPLSSLVDAAGRLAGNDLATRVDPRGPPELRQLAQAFNVMAVSLQARTAELREALVQAEQASEAKSTFLSRMSHELRTPLNAILGFSQILETEDLTERQHEDVMQIIAAGRHLLKLVDEVLDIAQVMSGSMRLTLRPVDVSEVIQDAVDSTRHLAIDRGVSVVTELPEGRPPEALADPAGVRQILLHLVTNGIKYNRRDGCLRIVAGEGHGQVHIVVSDTGPGIPPEKVPKLFVAFEREHAGIDGVGLGLALSRRLAEEMNGNLDVATELGRGSTFTLRLQSATDTGSLSDAETGRSGPSAGLAAP